MKYLMLFSLWGSLLACQSELERLTSPSTPPPAPSPAALFRAQLVGTWQLHRICTDWSGPCQEVASPTETMVIDASDNWNISKQQRIARHWQFAVHPPQTEAQQWWYFLQQNTDILIIESPTGYRKYVRGS